MTWGILYDFNFNNYIDRCIGKLKHIIKESLNPLYLEPTESTFKYGLWFISKTGQFYLDNTTIHNLANVSRCGFPQLKYMGKNIHLSWTMTFPEVEMRSSYALRLLNMSRNGHVKAKMENILADVELKFDLTKMKASLNNIKLRSKGRIHVVLSEEHTEKVSSLSSAIVKAVANLFKRQILETIEDSIKETVEETVKGVEITGDAN